MSDHGTMSKEDLLRIMRECVDQNEGPFCGTALLVTGKNQLQAKALVGGCLACQVLLAARLVAIVRRNMAEEGVPENMVSDLFASAAEYVNKGELRRERREP